MSTLIKLTSAKSKFFTAARFPKPKDSSKLRDDDSDITFVLSISASVEKRVTLDGYGLKAVADQEAHWPNATDSYELQDVIGVGNYTLVYSALCKTRSETCAIKVFDLKKWDQSGLDELLKEVVQLSTISHSNVIAYYSTFVDKGELWLVMKFMENGSLFDLIQRKKRIDSCKHGVFDEETIATILSEVVNGLTFLHEQAYIHRNIKAENILLGKDGSVKIADFCIANSISKRRAYIGSPHWLAPEIIHDKLHIYSPKADVWSLGITAIETATGSPPYHKFSTMKVLLMISLNESPTLETNAQTRDQYDKYGRAFRSFLSDCLKKDLHKRKPVKELLFHPFFQKAKDRAFLEKLFASIPPFPESKSSISVQEVDIKERKEWVLTNAEMLSEPIPPEPEVSEESVPRAHSYAMQQEDKSVRSFNMSVSKDRRRHISYITLKIRGIRLDTPLILKTSICDKRALFDVSFSHDPARDKPESVVEDLIREGLVHPNDREPILTNLKKLLETTKSEGDHPPITFRLNSEISNDETICEWNLVGYATLMLRSLEALSSSSPSFTGASRTSYSSKVSM